MAAARLRAGFDDQDAVKADPASDGLILGSHGLFTWGATQRECYLNSIRTIDEMGQFIDAHRARRPVRFGGTAHKPVDTRREIAARVLPALRGALSATRRVIAHFAEDAVSLEFAGSAWAAELGRLGTSCPDHFLRTRICPLVVEWDPASGDVGSLEAAFTRQIATYRADYTKYYESFATADSPKLRDSSPSVVIIPGVGLFGFGKNKKEARITTEFFINAINVMEGATALEDEGHGPAKAGRGTATS